MPKKHIVTYMDYFGYGIDDVIYCEVCRKGGSGGAGMDCHHIRPRSLGGGDNIDNIICLCRSCHNSAHNKDLSERDLSLVHKRFMSRPTTGVFGKKC